MNRICLAAAFLLLLSSCGGSLYESLNRQAAEEYLQPIRPASEGRNPCWNKFAKKFIYAPAFDVPVPSDAISYRFTVSNGSENWSFSASRPDASLAPVWNSIPPGPVTLCVEARLICDMYDTVYTRSFLRDYPFEGPYKEAVRDYREAAIKGALYVHMMPEVQHWIGSDVPDMAYSHNTYPCKIIGATIRNECLIAKELPERRENALAVARSAAAFLIAQSRPADAPLAYFPPTYYLDREASKREWNQGKTMTLEAASAGQAFLDKLDLMWVSLCGTDSDSGLDPEADVGKYVSCVPTDKEGVYEYCPRHSIIPELQGMLKNGGRKAPEGVRIVIYRRIIEAAYAETVAMYDIWESKLKSSEKSVAREYKQQFEDSYAEKSADLLDYYRKSPLKAYTQLADWVVGLMVQECYDLYGMEANTVD